MLSDRQQRSILRVLTETSRLLPIADHISRLLAAEDDSPASKTASTTKALVRNRLTSIVCAVESTPLGQPHSATSSVDESGSIPLETPSAAVETMVNSLDQAHPLPP